MIIEEKDAISYQCCNKIAPCSGKQCMAWRWDYTRTGDTGYCGLAGKPASPGWRDEKGKV